MRNPTVTHIIRCRHCKRIFGLFYSKNSNEHDRFYNICKHARKIKTRYEDAERILTLSYNKILWHRKDREERYQP